MLDHGINIYQADSNYKTVSVNKNRCSIPFFVGAWPCHTANGFTGKPQIAGSFAEAKDLGGYSEEWRENNGNPKWNLCQAMYSHFKLFKMAPAVFYNVYDPATHKQAVAAAAFTVSNHTVELPADTIIDSGLTVVDDETTLTKDTDYIVFYNENKVVVSLISTSTHYSATTLSIGFNKANPSAITKAHIEAAIEKIEECKTMLNIVPDLICIPGWSSDPEVAAVMAAKAPSINGLYKGKAVVDLSTAAGAAPSYSDVATYKTAQGYTDENMIVCWPLYTADDRTFDASVIVCGIIAQIDHDNDDVPYESPSNKPLPISGCKNAAGTEINLTVQQADTVSYTAGVVTAINFGEWLLWGNYTGAGQNESVDKSFICTSRMHDYVDNRFIDENWTQLDKPLSRVLIDTIVNSFNSFLNGLAHEGKIVSGEIKYISDNNNSSSLLAGKFRLDLTLASPIPAQQINLHSEFDVDALLSSIEV